MQIICICNGEVVAWERWKNHITFCMALEWKYSPEADTLRRKGLHATRRRVAILRLLGKTRTPLSAEQIHAKLAGSDLVTVYRSLASFEDAGLVSKVRLGRGSARFERAGEHHHHLVCTSCEKMEELDIPEKDMDKAALKSSKIFSRVSGHSLEFFGLCRTCA